MSFGGRSAPRSGEAGRATEAERRRATWARALVPALGLGLLACSHGRASTTSSSAGVTAPSSRAFRPGVVATVIDLVSRACAPPCPAHETPPRARPGIAVTSICELERASDQQHLVVTADVAPAGSLIEWAEGDDPGAPDPVTGERRRARLAGGPGGSFRGVELVTRDGCLDVVVGVAERLPEGVELECDPNRLARSLSEAFAAAEGESGCERFFGSNANPSHD
jgi:hypothetical protein